MTKVVNVRFRDAGKAYRFTTGGLSLGIGDSVIVETEQGIDLAHVCEEPYDLEGDVKDILPIKRLATEADLKAYDEKCAKEKDAMVKCRELIERRELEMNLVDCAFTLDGKKVVFYFTADGRVDFRELVKDLAYAFHTRIELRQIGSRDQAKLVGGIGICGRELCCCCFLNHFAPVNLKLARQQGLSLNPGKLNGACGRLMCCLQFEKEAYEDAHNRLPEQGKRVRTPEGVGVVCDVNYIEETISVKFTSENETEIQKFPWAELEPLNSDMKPGCRNCPKRSSGNNGANESTSDLRGEGAPDGE